MKRLVLFLGMVTLLAGCANTSTTTTLRSDGSYTRTIKFTVQKSMGEEASLDKVFKLPSGAQWKVKTTDDKDKIESVLTMEAKVGDAPLSDLQVKTKTGFQVVNSFAVTEPTPGQFEYKETFTWKGKPDKNPEESLAQMRASLKKLLPADTSDATITAIATDMRGDIWKLMFGPGDPMLLSLFTNPEFAAKKLGTAIGKSLASSLDKRVPTWGTEESRRAAVRKFVVELTADDLLKKPDPEKQSEQDDSNGPIPMYVCVKVPGKIVETNGEFDPISGDVYWALYPEAAQLGPVTLRVLCEAK